MKNLLYIIAGLLVIFWFIIFPGFNSSKTAHVLLALAGFIILFSAVFDKELSGK